MGGFGWHNPWPFEWGGGPTEFESTYEAWRKTLGTLPAKDDSGIDGLWRRCRAEIVAIAASMAERAVLQAFPQVATDHLPPWEEYLGIVPSGSATEEERRRNVCLAYTRRALADGPDLLAQLKAIDARFWVDNLSHHMATTTIAGDAFDSGWPNFASEFVLPVRMDTTARVPTEAERLAMLRAKDLLNEALPAWVDFQIATSQEFYLDSSPLDFTMLTERS
jgi:hypothetical protein